MDTASGMEKSSAQNIQLLTTWLTERKENLKALKQSQLVSRTKMIKPYNSSQAS